MPESISRDGLGNEDSMHPSARFASTAQAAALALALLGACRESAIPPEAYEIDSLEIACPPGAEKVRRHRPVAYLFLAEWCERPRLLWGRVPHGPRIAWYESGGKQLRDYWVDGEREGRVATWYGDGQLRMVSGIRHGKPHGVTVAWYENGQKWWEKHNLDGHADGPWLRWHDNGVTEEKGQYRSGRKTGVWLRWDRRGRLVDSQDYDPE